MPETPSPAPAPSERTVVIPAGRFRLLTILSIANAVVLLLLIIGFAVHHHRMKHRGHGFAGGDRCPMCESGFERGGPGRFHHFHRFGDEGGPGDGPRGNFGGDEHFGPGENFRPGGGEPIGDGPRAGMGGLPPGAGMAPDPAKMTDDILRHLDRQLALTDDEKAKIKPLVEADVQQFQKDSEAFRQSMQKRIEDAKAQIRPLLTADQQKQLDALPMPGGRPPESGAPGGN